MNEARSPESVFEAQLEEVIIELGTAGCVTLDPGGAARLQQPDR